MKRGAAPIFSARVVPIPAYGTKRIEIEYQERLAVEQGEAYLLDSPAARMCIARRRPGA